jgi:hypothetical protein
MRLVPLLTIFSFFISGCAGVYKHELNFNPLEPIRVAVLPFAFVDENRAIVDKETERNLVDNLSIVSTELEESPATFIQTATQKELSKTSLDIVAPAYVDAQLSHNGYDNRGKGLDIPKIFQAAPKELCTLLHCDALLYGRVTRWERNYYGLQSQTLVGAEIKIISARDSSVFYTSTAEDSDSRGISKGPTGFSNLVIEPIKGLSNDVITKLARKVVAKMIQPLTVSSRPGFLETPPPAIFASAHDARSGSLDFAHPLTVVLLGNPKQNASFSIGTLIRNIPMIEKDDGHYFGQYYPLSTDSFNNQSVHVALQDKYGRVTSQRIGFSKISLAPSHE